MTAQALAQQEQPAWIDIAHRTSIVSAVYEQLKKEFTGYIAPFDRLDADTVQRLVDSIKWMTQPAQDPIFYQYRWTNPGDNKDVSEFELDWKTVELRNPYTDTIESRIEELKSSRYNGKNCYEVRGLFAHQAPTQPALSDAEILNCFSASKAEGMASYMLAVGRAIEAHCRGGATS